MDNNRLIELSKPFFESNKDLDSLIITDDGNVFYKEARSFAIAHCKQNNTKENFVTRKMYDDLLKEKKSTVKAETKKTEKKEEKVEEIVETKKVDEVKTK